MSGSTSRVSLYKPAGGENVNVTTDLNNNFDKLDTNLSFRVAASASARNAISPYWEGLNVRDTDTGRTWVSNGSAPISASWSQIPNSGSTYDANLNLTSDKQLNIGSSASTASVAVVNSGASSDAISSRVTGDTQSRFVMDADGTMYWGPGGSTATDTGLYRGSAGLLATNGSLQIAGQLLLTNGGTAVKNATPSVATGPITTSTTETIIASYTIPANDATAGAVYKITAWGICSTISGQTVTFKSRMGGTSGASNASIGVAGTATVSNKVWKAELWVAILTTGSSGTWTGNLTVEEGISVSGTNPVVAVTRMDGSGTATINTTTSNVLAITSTWSASNASNSITCRGFGAERIA